MSFTYKLLSQTLDTNLSFILHLLLYTIYCSIHCINPAFAAKRNKPVFIMMLRIHSDYSFISHVVSFSECNDIWKHSLHTKHSASSYFHRRSFVVHGLFSPSKLHKPNKGLVIWYYICYACALEAINCWICKVTDRPLVNVTPKILMCWIRFRPFNVSGVW